MTMPDDPFKGFMREAAAQLHEIYANYVEVGFTEIQAFELVKTIVHAQIALAIKNHNNE